MTEWVVYCPNHRHYLVFSGVTGTTWTDDQDKAHRYGKREAITKAKEATWLDHNPTYWALGR